MIPSAQEDKVLLKKNTSLNPLALCVSQLSIEITFKKCRASPKNLRLLLLFPSSPLPSPQPRPAEAPQTRARSPAVSSPVLPDAGGNLREMFYIHSSTALLEYVAKMTSCIFKVSTIRAHISRGPTAQCPVKTIIVTMKYNIYGIYEYVKYESDLFKLPKNPRNTQIYQVEVFWFKIP